MSKHEEAILLVLEHETEIITKALRPVLRPPSTYAYLRSRKHVTCFLDSSIKPGQGDE